MSEHTGQTQNTVFLSFFITVMMFSSFAVGFLFSFQVQPSLPVLGSCQALFHSTLAPSSGNIALLPPHQKVSWLSLFIDYCSWWKANPKSWFFSLCVADVSLKYKHGRLALEVPLPSRNENCLFYLRPLLMSVGDLIADVHKEDPGATASVFSKGIIAYIACVHTG